MLTLLFIICFFAVFGKLLMFGIKAAWGAAASAGRLRPFSVRSASILCAIVTMMG